MEVGGNWCFVRAKVTLSAVCVWKPSFLSGLTSELLPTWFSEKLVPVAAPLWGRAPVSLSEIGVFSCAATAQTQKEG